MQSMSMPVGVIEHLYLRWIYNMRKITETRTGKIVSDTDLKLEYLYVGDYG